MRLFVAAYPPPAVLADFVTHVSTLAVGAPREPGRSVRLVPPERVHLTLTFLGDVPDERRPAVEEAVAAGVARWSASGGGRSRDDEDRRTPVLRIGGGGRFGRGRFTVLWAGVRGDTAALGDLVTDLRRELRSARLPFDAKAHRPHVTVARPGDRIDAGDLAADLSALSGYEGPDWHLTEVTLVRSHPGPVPVYDRLATFTL